MNERPTAQAGRFRTMPERSADFAHLTLDGLRMLAERNPAPTLSRDRVKALESD